MAAWGILVWFIFLCPHQITSSKLLHFKRSWWIHLHSLPLILQGIIPPLRCFHCQPNSPSFSFFSGKKTDEFIQAVISSCSKRTLSAFSAVFHVKHWIPVNYIPPICHNPPDTVKAPRSKALQIIRARGDTKFCITKLKQGSNSSILSKQCERNQTFKWWTCRNPNCAYTIWIYQAKSLPPSWLQNSEVLGTAWISRWR